MELGEIRQLKGRRPSCHLLLDLRERREATTALYGDGKYDGDDADEEGDDG